MRNDRRRELTPRELNRLRRKQQIKRRRLAALIVAVVVVVVIIVLLVKGCGGGPSSTTTTTNPGDTTTTLAGAATFKATLTGTEAVPEVDTTATGTLTLTWDPVQDKLSFQLNATDLDSPTSAYIYEGASGENGTAVYTLYAPDTPSTEQFSGILQHGDIDETALKGSLDGKTLVDLVALLSSGNAYVAIGTKAHPTEAIRGQISQTSGSDGSDTTVSTDNSGSTGTSANDSSSTDTTAKKSTSTTKKSTSTTKKTTTT
jgi:hypothetical protein